MTKKKERLYTVMSNVMAALHTWGVEYSVNFYGFRVKKSLEDVLEKYGEPVLYEGREGGENFQKKMEAFLNIKGYYHLSGTCWAEDEDGDYVIITLERGYILTDKDWEEEAKFYGCAPYEVESLYGPPLHPSIYFSVRISKYLLREFVRRYAKYCWD